jgi:hypothetical protein
MGVVLQQHVKNAWQPLAFFSKKLHPDQQKYRVYDRELLAIYEAVKHFRHMLGARHFTIFTDHKPITYAFQKKRDKCSPRQFNNLDIVAQFTTDIRHIPGQDKIVTDPLSCVESVTVPPSYNALDAAQDGDDELRTLLGSTTALRLEKLPIPGTTVSIYCDTSAGGSRPYDPGPRWLQVFQSPTICRTRSPKQRRSWSRSVLRGQACRIAAPGHVLASPASAPRSPGIQ